jgi:hypothetical protein
MLLTPSKSRQPPRAAWSRERLFHERAVALGHALDRSTVYTYNSHLQSYLTFCKLHQFPLEPTPDTLSFYIVFMAHHIKPNSVVQYLSGIVNALEPHFPNVRLVRHGSLVKRTLDGMRKLRGHVGTTRKRALTEEDMHKLLHLSNSNNLDDLLLVTITFTAFHALLRLGEVTQPDSLAKRSARKLSLRHTVNMTAAMFSFVLPSHKADRFFEGSSIVVEARDSRLCPLLPFRKYLSVRDARFPFHPHLWLRATGQPPTYSWVVGRLRDLLGADVAGHSMRSGGATALALAGVPDDHIQARGRWSSESYRIYIRKHPVMLQSLLYGRSAFDLRK